MGSTPYVAVSWDSHEVITKDKMDQMQFDLQWLFENSPRGRFMTSNGYREDGIVVVSGRLFVPRSKYEYDGIGHVKFGTTFAPGTAINVTTGIISDQKKEVFCTVRGVNGTQSPDSRGFDVEIGVEDISARPAKVRGKTQQDPPDRSIYVCWRASGIRYTYG